jgi:F-type H+-transporting ATPase subunit b
MLIDWFTVFAQVVNFLILIWLLKRFLYKPILGAMEAREQKIAAQLRDAATQKAEAERERESLRVARAAFEAQREDLLKKAADEAESTRRRLSDEVRQEIETVRAKWHETLRHEQDALRAELTSRAQREIFAIAKQTLRDLAGKELEQQIATVFVRQLKAINGAEKDQLVTILKTSRKPAVIRSAFDLRQSERAEIENAITQALVPDLPVRFEIASDLVSGIELAANGHKISWSITGYLASLEKSVRDVVEKKVIPDEISK